MTNKGFSIVPFHVLDRITDRFPSFAPSIFEKGFISIAGSQKVYSNILKKFQRKLKRIKSFERILVIVDVNIGDAILIKQSLKVLKSYFPASQIDYVCSKQCAELITGPDETENIIGIFRKGGIPSREDIMELKGLIKMKDYTLILNLSPFINRINLPLRQVITLIVPFAYYIMHLWKLETEIMQLSSALSSFLHDFLTPVFVMDDIRPNKYIKYLKWERFKGNTIYLSEDSIKLSLKFLFENGIVHERLMLLNPDSTVVYNLIPVETQKNIVRSVLQSGCVDKVLISSAYNFKKIEKQIILGLSPELREKVVIIPHVPLDVYAALIDNCEVFLSGDTGPLHIAASWKKPLSRNFSLRNSTAVVSVFGATDSRIYGYDSFQPGHIPANQNAPSRAFSSEAPCRNITCINKSVKSCKEIRCFNNLDGEKISSYIISYLMFLHDYRKAV